MLKDLVFRANELGVDVDFQPLVPEGIRMDQVIAVGDGANDLPMLNSAGLGIAFLAKPIVRAGQATSTVGLDGVLYLMGIPDRETN